jgi:hypothetical protein
MVVFATSTSGRSPMTPLMLRMRIAVLAIVQTAVPSTSCMSSPGVQVLVSTVPPSSRISGPLGSADRQR